MKKFFSLMRSSNRTISMLALLSITSILAIDLYFGELPELFHGGEKLLNAYYNFCIGLVASYVFYLIVVHVKEQSDKDNVKTYVFSKSRRVVGNYKSVIRAIKKEVGYMGEEDYFEQEKIHEFFLKVVPNSDAPMISSYDSSRLNWVQFLNDYRMSSIQLIDKILKIMPYLDTEHIRLLSAIEDSHYFIEINGLSGIGNPDISIWSKTFYKYSLDCKALEKYNSRFG
ncbi:hypothetical protein A6E08_21460 [Vibrio lentus]|nr:hypothetical protein A6E08_21460 [Vibrio lentus]PMI58983.1 hypothetical protein BCU41_23220 [Vibrio lentus]